MLSLLLAVSTVFGTVSSLHPTSFFILVYYILYIHVYPCIRKSVLIIEVSLFQGFKFIRFSIHVHMYTCICRYPVYKGVLD